MIFKVLFKLKLFTSGSVISFSILFYHFCDLQLLNLAELGHPFTFINDGSDWLRDVWSPLQFCVYIYKYYPNDCSFMALLCWLWGHMASTIFFRSQRQEEDRCLKSITLYSGNGVFGLFYSSVEPIFLFLPLIVCVGI